MADPIRVGVIGTGGIFRGLHVPYFETTSLANIVAVTDVSESAACEQGEKFGAEVCKNYRDLLDRDDVDAVDICTHPGPHRDIAVACAEAGKHILLEKPMCCTVAEGRDMIAAAKAANVRLQIAYMMRFHPCYEKLKELLDGDALGAVHMVYSNQVGWFAPKHPWLFIKKESGGMLVEQAIHHLDLWLWLFGPVATVYARTSTADVGGTYPDLEEAVENNATVVMGFASGATGMLMKSWAAEEGHNGDGLVAEKGSATYSQQQVRWKTHDMADAEVFVPDVPDDDTYPQLTGQARAGRYWSCASKGRGIDHWLKCILGEEEPLTSGEVGCAGIAIAEAAYRSSAGGAPVAV